MAGMGGPTKQVVSHGNGLSRQVSLYTTACACMQVTSNCWDVSLGEFGYVGQ